MAVELRYAVLGVLAMTCLLGNSPLAAAAGKTITAAGCSSANVQSAMNSAVDGDTVIVPAGSCTWTSAVWINSVNLGGTLQGAGIGQTIITNGSSSRIVNNSAGRWAIPRSLLPVSPLMRTCAIRDRSHSWRSSGAAWNAFRLHHFEMINLIERGISIDLDGNEGQWAHRSLHVWRACQSRRRPRRSPCREPDSEEHQPFSPAAGVGIGEIHLYRGLHLQLWRPERRRAGRVCRVPDMSSGIILSTTRTWKHHGADSGFIAWRTQF